MSDGEFGDKLRAYFRDLAPEARLMLGTALAKAGGAVAHADMILGALKDAMRDRGEIIPLENLAALIFAPSERFVVIEKSSKVSGLIAASSLQRVWRWLEHDGAPEAIAGFRAEVEGDPLGRVRSETITQLRQDCTTAILATAQEGLGDQMAMQRVSVRLSSDRVAEDLHDIGLALHYAELLKGFDADLTADLKLPFDDSVDVVRQRLTALSVKEKAVLPLALVMLKQRINSLSGTVRFLIALGGTAKIELLFDSPYRGLVELVMFDAERAMLTTQTGLGAADTSELVASIREFGAALRAIGAELEFDTRSPLAKHINALRKGMSEALSGRMTDLTLRMKQLIRPRATAARAVDADEIDRLDADIALLMAARQYADDIAIKADTQRVYGELKDLLDTGMPLLIDRLRGVPFNERGEIRQRLEAVVRVSGRLIGEEYAALVAKAIHVADVPPPAKQAASG